MKKREFEITFNDSNENLTVLKVEHDHYAEQILRGLVHSGFEVTIKEVFREMTVEEKKEQGYYETQTCVPEPCPEPVYRR